MKNPSPAALILPFQPTLCPAWPVVLGNVDYQEFEFQLRRMDQLLSGSGVEKSFVEQCLARFDVASFDWLATTSAPISAAAAEGFSLLSPSKINS